MRGVAYTDVIQGVLLLVGFVAMIIIGITEYGGKETPCKIRHPF